MPRKSPNREWTKANVLWPLLLCVAGALCLVGVGGVVCFFVCVVVWCGVALWSWVCGVHWVLCVCFLFVALCCVHGVVVFVAEVFMGLCVWWVRQWLCWASHETPNKTHCRTHHATKKRMYVFENMSSHSVPLKATLRFPKATVVPLKATGSHATFSKKPLSSHSKPLPSHSENPQKIHFEPLKSSEGHNKPPRALWVHYFQVRG